MACSYQYKGKTYTRKQIEKLLSKDESFVEKQIIQPYLNYTVNDDGPLREIFNILPNETLDSYVRRNLDTKKLFEINPDVKLIFDENKSSGYEQETNTVNISISEIYQRANEQKKDYDVMFDYFLKHELKHAITIPGLSYGSNLENFTTLYNKVIQMHLKKPFVDKYRMGWEETIVGTNNETFSLPYAFKNPLELASDAFTNPYLKKWLKSISNGQESLWDRIINFFGDILGFPRKDNIYDEIDAFFTNQQFEAESIAATSEDSNIMNIFEKQFANNYSLNTLNIITGRDTNVIDPVIQKAFDSIPAAITQLRKLLKDGKIQESQARNIQTLIQQFYNVSNNKDKIASGIKMIDAAYNITQDINRNMFLLNDELDDEIKLKKLTLYIQQANSLDFLIPLLRDIQLFLKKPENRTADTDKFNNELRAIIDVKGELSKQYNELTRPLLIRIMAADLGELPEAKRITDLIAKNLAIAEKSTNPNEKRRYNDIAEDLIKSLDKIPIPATLEKAMAGDLEDASYTDMQFAARSFNAHPFIQSLSNMIKRKDLALTKRTQRLKNVMATEVNLLKRDLGVKSTRSMPEVFKPIEELVEIYTKVEEDENGNPKPIKIKMRKMLSNYDKTYQTHHSELVVLTEYWNDKRINAKTNEEKDKNSNEYTKAKENLNSFLTEHAQRPYEDDYYIPLEILKEKLDTKKIDTKTGLPIYTSLQETRGEVFQKVRDLESQKQKAILASDRKELEDKLENAYRDIQELANKFDKNGILKQDIELLLAEQSIKYREAKQKTGKYEFTEEDKISYQYDVDFIEENYTKDVKSYNDEIALNEQNLNNDKITIEQYEKIRKRYNDLKEGAENTRNRALDNIQVTKLSEEYYDVVKDLYIDIDNKLSILLANEDISNLFNKLDRTVIKEGYADIREISKAYRNNKGVINGIAFQQNKPESVKVIQKIQQTIANLTSSSASLKSISKVDRMRIDELKDLEKKKLFTDAEKTELNELLIKESSVKKTYAQNKIAIDEYFKAIQKLSELSTSETSSYYADELNTQLNQFTIDAEKQIEDDFDEYIKNQNIFLLDGKYGKNENIKGADGKIVLSFNPITDNKRVLISGLARERASLDLKNSEWFKNNHYTSYQFSDNIAEGLVEVEKPIYIWNKQTPKDDRFIVPAEPSERYQTFVPNPLKENKNYKLVADRLGIPKEGSKYALNPTYQALKNNNSTEGKALFRFLEFARKTKYTTEEETNMLDSQRTFDLYPSMPKTENENKINLTNSVFNGEAWRNIKRATIGLSENQDEQFAQKGNMIKSPVVPYRFNHLMESEKQTSDLISALLSYDNANMNSANMKELEFIFEAVQEVTKTLPVLDTKILQGALSMRKILNVIKGKSNQSDKSISEKKYQDSILHQTVTHMLDTFVRGETKTNGIMNTFAGDIDAHKLVSSVKKVASRAIFAFKIFSPFKNGLSSKINAILNSNIGEKFFTLSDITKATMEAPKYIPDLLKDYRKIGNKSDIGQALDRFQVLHGGVQDGFGKVVQWSAIAETGHFITLPKNIQELEGQLSIFLAISKANKVKLKDGKMVDFHEAFEKKSDGSFDPKEGTNITEDDILKFVNKVSISNQFLNGSFKADEKSKIEKHPLGSMLTYLNGYVMPGIINRFGSEFYSVEAEQMMKGYYNEGIQFIQDYFKYGRDLKTTWGSLTNVEKARVNHFISEVSTAIFLGLLALVMGSGDDKKKLAKNSGGYNFLLALTMAVASEVQTFIPVPYLGGDEILRKLKSPFAAVSQITSIGVLFGNLLAIMNPLDGDSGRYKQSGVKDGLHDKDDPKFIANFIKLTGFNFTEFSDLDKVMAVKQQQTFRP